MKNARTVLCTPLFSDGVRKQGRLLWGWGLGLMNMCVMGKIKSLQGSDGVYRHGEGCLGSRRHGRIF